MAAFVESLPRAYGNKYDPEVVIAHAGVSAFRGGAKASVGLFGRAGNGMCVVADDRPGLLAIFAASLVVCHFDVTHAEVFTRDVGGGKKEAVDLFWVRKLDQPPGASLVKTDAELLETTITRFLDGTEDPRVAVDREVARAGAGPRKAVDATVRFVPDHSGGLATLEVETTDRSGLLFSLASALFGQRVQIVESEVHTDGDRVFDRFRLVELDGAPIDSSHRLEIQVAVLNAIEPARRSTPPTR